MPEFLHRNANILFLIYLGVGTIFLLSIESVFNGGFNTSMRLAWAPLAILVFGFTWIYRKAFYNLSGSPIRVWVLAVMGYPVFLLFSWPYFLAVNALIPSTKDVIYSGPIIEKFITRGTRSTSYQVTIHDETLDTEVTLTISSCLYKSTVIGSTLHQSFQIGALNIPYRWRFSHSERAYTHLDHKG